MKDMLMYIDLNVHIVIFNIISIYMYNINRNKVVSSNSLVHKSISLSSVYVRGWQHDKLLRSVCCR